MHPSLGFDLTGEMMAAAHEIGVAAPVYVTVGWSDTDAKRHPEWVMRCRDGTMSVTNGPLHPRPEERKEPGCWRNMCINSGYGDHVHELTREICDRYPSLDGLWYDICFLHTRFGPCYCQKCSGDMEREGLDPGDRDAAMAFQTRVWNGFAEGCIRILKQRHADAEIFFNWGAEIYCPEFHGLNSHFELEDLPTAGEGYDKIQMRAKYFSQKGKDVCSMTGKFHYMWGEFGGFKTAAALKYETAAMMAYGTKCCIGDQLHPCGEMDRETYRIIGEAYQYAEEIEPWCFDARETARLGIWLSGDSRSDDGAARMLLEKQIDFNVLEGAESLSAYDVVILPDRVQLEESEAEMLNRFVGNGGGVLLTAASGLDKDRTRFLVDVGAEYQGLASYENDYLVVGDRLGKDLVRSPILFYRGAEKVRVTDGEVLAGIREPYFDRTFAHFCSHLNTPYRMETADHPAAVRKGNVIYLAHPVFANYHMRGAQMHRDYLLNALKEIYREPTLEIDTPSSARVRLIRQIAENRYVLHVLYASPIYRAGIPVIEDLPPVYDVKVTIRVKEPVKNAYLAPGMTDIPFVAEGGRVRLTISRVQCHQMVVLDLA